MTRLLIARHGNTFEPGDPPRRVGARTDLPLASKGLAQAEAIGNYLLKNYIIPDAVYTGTLQRTIQTAQGAMVAAGLDCPVHQTDILNEIDYGPDENRIEDDVRARLGAHVLNAWDEEGIAPPGWIVDPERIIENWRNFAETIVKNDPGGTVLAVTSNGIARFAPYLTGDFEGFRAQNGLKIATGALCALTHNPDSGNGRDGWSVGFWNVRPPLS